MLLTCNLRACISASAVEPTPSNRFRLSADIGALNRLDWRPGAAVLAPNYCSQKDDGTGGRYSFCITKEKS